MTPRIHPARLCDTLIPCRSRGLLALALAVVLGLALVPAVQAQEVCIQVITFAENPDTGECIAFPTPCDVPQGWAPCGPGGVLISTDPALAPTEGAIEMVKPEVCAQVITFARNPETGQCEAFPTPCDVPEGWELCTFPVFP